MRGKERIWIKKRRKRRKKTRMEKREDENDDENEAEKRIRGETGICKLRGIGKLA